jgi:hypothetical protein
MEGAMSEQETGVDAARDMPFREKSAWVSLTTSVAVYGWYFATYAAALADGHATRALFSGRLVGTFFVLVVLGIALQVVIAVRAPSDANAPADERERLIHLKATRIAYAVLATGVVLTIGALWAGSESFFAMNMLFFFFVAASVANYATEIVLFRRSA